MESVAPPGGVMLSESTARLVEHLAMLAEPEWVHIKGADEPVRARRLVAIEPTAWPARARRSEPGRSALGDGRPRRHVGAHDRWPRWSSWVWWVRRVSASPGWRGRPRRWRPAVGSRCFGPSASHMPVTFPSTSVAQLLRGGHRCGRPGRRSRPRPGPGSIARCRPAGSAAVR